MGCVAEGEGGCDVEGWIVWLRERAGVRVMGGLCG